MSTPRERKPVIPLSPPVTLRAARIEDYERLCALYDELDAYHRAARPDLFVKPEGPARSRARIEEIVSGEKSALFVAECFGTIQGFCAVIEKKRHESPVRRPESYVEIDELVVGAKYRRRGIARRLLRRAEDWARSRGVDVVTIGVWSFNDAARALYASQGYDVQTLRLAKRL